VPRSNGVVFLEYDTREKPQSILCAFPGIPALEQDNGKPQMMFFLLTPRVMKAEDEPMRNILYKTHSDII
jgi:hypothetical protein